MVSPDKLQNPPIELPEPRTQKVVGDWTVLVTSILNNKINVVYLDKDENQVATDTLVLQQWESLSGDEVEKRAQLQSQQSKGGKATSVSLPKNISPRKKRERFLKPFYAEKATSEFDEENYGLVSSTPETPQVKPTKHQIEEIKTSLLLKYGKGLPDAPKDTDINTKKIAEEERSALYNQKKIENASNPSMKKLDEAVGYFNYLVAKTIEDKGHFHEAQKIINDPRKNELEKYVALLEHGVDSFVTHGNDKVDDKGERTLSVGGDLDSYFSHFVLRRVLGSYRDSRVYGSVHRFPEKIYVPKGKTASAIGSSEKIYLISDTGNKNELSVKKVGNSIVLTADHHEFGGRIEPTSVTEMHYLLLKSLGKMDRLPKADQHALEEIAKLSVAEDNYTFDVNKKTLLTDYPNSMLGIYRGITDDEIYQILKTKKFDEPFTEQELERKVRTRNGYSKKLRHVVERHKKRLTDMLENFRNEIREGGMVEEYESSEFGNVGFITIRKGEKFPGVNIIAKAMGYDVVAILDENTNDVFVSAKVTPVEKNGKKTFPQKSIDVVYERLRQKFPDTAFPRGTMILKRGGEPISKEGLLDILNLDTTAPLKDSDNSFTLEEKVSYDTMRSHLYKEKGDNAYKNGDIDGIVSVQTEIAEKILALEKIQGEEYYIDLLYTIRGDLEMKKRELIDNQTHAETNKKKDIEDFKDEDDLRLPAVIERTEKEILDIDAELAELKTALLEFQIPEVEEVVVSETEEKGSREDLEAKKSDIERRRKEELKASERKEVIIPNENVIYWSNSRELTKEEAYTTSGFALFNITGDEADIAYVGTPVNPDLFAEKASFLNNPSLVKIEKIITVKAGKAIKEKGNWKIVKPIKIAFNTIPQNETLIKTINAKYDAELAGLENKLGEVVVSETEEKGSGEDLELKINAIERAYRFNNDRIKDIEENGDTFDPMIDTRSINTKVEAARNSLKGVNGLLLKLNELGEVAYEKWFAENVDDIVINNIDASDGLGEYLFKTNLWNKEGLEKARADILSFIENNTVEGLKEQQKKLLATLEEKEVAPGNKDTSDRLERETILNSLRGAMTMKDKKLRDALLLAMHWGPEEIVSFGGPKKALEKVMRDFNITEKELK